MIHGDFQSVFADQELWSLTEAMCDGSISPDQLESLESLLRDDEQARLFFASYMDVHGRLLWRFRGGGQTAPDMNESEPVGLPFTIDADPETPSFPTFPSLSTTHYPLSTNFVGGPVFSYMVATLVLCMMVLGAWAYKITRDVPIATNAPAPSLIEKNSMQFVARITGANDCRWPADAIVPMVGSYVSLGRKYSLDAGLLQITYDSGARVILEGPCVYTVDSDAGGWLQLGKLVARVENRGGLAASATSAKPQAANPQPPAPSPQPLAPLFTITTPTAVVTDLGTEFGVEVTSEGRTDTHVFQGTIKVTVIAGKDTAIRSRVCRKGEAVRVDAEDSSIREIAADEDATKCFVRIMPKPKPVRESDAYEKFVLSLHPAVYFRMEPSKDEKNNRVVFDFAPGGHHGELRLGNEYGRPYLPGRFGKSLWFRGPEVCDHVIVPDYPKATNDQLTVSAWVLATGRPGWATIASNWELLEGERVNVGQFHFSLYRRDGDLCAHITQRDGQHVEVREGAEQPFPVGVWQHVVLVADGSTLHLYRDGKEVASTPCAGIMPQPSMVSLGIGCRTNEAGTEASPVPSDNRSFRTGYHYWQGRIDELVVFNQVLTAETVRRLCLGKPSQNRQVGTASAGKGDEPLDSR